MAAVRDYESIGGTAAIFINDDGMQIIESDIAEFVSEWMCHSPS